MNKTPWIFQYKREVAAKGDAASWYVGWYDHHGKRHAESCGKGSAGHNRAEKRQRRLQAELDMGVHRAPTKTLWTEFVEQFERDVLPGLEPTTRRAYRESLKKFEEHTKILRVESIDTRMIDSFIARRRNDPGKKAGASVSPATIAKDLRLIKAALGRAVDWGYLAVLPKFRSVRQDEKIPRFVTDEDFGVLYTKACPLARHPAEPGQTYKAEDWWKALIVAAFMTGLRIKELMALRLEDIDFERGTVITRAGDNKGKRDAMLPLHPVVVEHLRRLGTASDCPLTWPLHERTLWAEWGRIQKAAGIHLPCSARHEHTAACRVYGFHDFRRAFATHNAPNLTPEALQKLMQHRSSKTTLQYINLATQVNQAAARYVVPEALQPGAGKGKSPQPPADN
ncbi:MAG: site-specific integrase [Verrucomicrobiota bacterium]